jgi:hypothetical protein
MPAITYPYSADPLIKRQEIWDNLQHGIHFEDNGVLIPWSTPFSAIDKYAEQCREGGDRTNWFLGQHQILDGCSCLVGVMKWSFVKRSRPFSQIDEWLGEDEPGQEKFLALKEKFTDLLGAPAIDSPEPFGAFMLGVFEWNYGKVKITLVGIEQFSLKYRMHIGLIENKNLIV